MKRVMFLLIGIMMIGGSTVAEGWPTVVRDSPAMDTIIPVGYTDLAISTKTNSIMGAFGVETSEPFADVDGKQINIDQMATVQGGILPALALVCVFTPIDDIIAAAAIGATIYVGHKIADMVTEFAAEHTDKARPSTKEKHQIGQARQQKDKGGEKGDKHRSPPRKSNREN